MHASREGALALLASHVMCMHDQSSCHWRRTWHRPPGFRNQSVCIFFRPLLRAFLMEANRGVGLREKETVMMWSGRPTLPQPSGRAVRGLSGRSERGRPTSTALGQAIRSAGGPLQPHSATFISGRRFLPSFIPTRRASAASTAPATERAASRERAGNLHLGATARVAPPPRHPPRIRPPCRSTPRRSSPPRRLGSPRRSSPPRLQPSSVPPRTPPPWRLRAALCHRNPSREGTKPVACLPPSQAAPNDDDAY
jgi:hypothetical protein